MKPLVSRVTKALPVGSYVNTCDNSGAKIVKIFSVKRHKTVKGRRQSAGIADMVQVVVKKGRPDIRKQVVFGVIVRQKKEFRRSNGIRIAFEDNAIVILKDEKGNPKGTIFKGAVAKEAAERWPGIAKVARIIV
jgi:large subunit ribosomal protein L14